MPIDKSAIIKPFPMYPPQPTEDELQTYAEWKSDPTAHSTVTHGWRFRAACAGTDWNMFFDEIRESEAKTVCARCPVRHDCLLFINRIEGSGKPPMLGVWAGMNWNDRVKWRKRVRAQRFREQRRNRSN